MSIKLPRDGYHLTRTLDGEPVLLVISDGSVNVGKVPADMADWPLGVYDTQWNLLFSQKDLLQDIEREGPAPFRDYDPNQPRAP